MSLLSKIFGGKKQAPAAPAKPKTDYPNAMPLKCPKCGTTVKIVNTLNMNQVYENFDKGDTGRCPGCKYQYRKR